MFEWAVHHTANGRGLCEILYFDAAQKAFCLVESSSRKTWTTYWLDGEAQDFPDIDSFTEHMLAVRRRDPTVMEVGRLRKIIAEHNINPDTGIKRPDGY